MANPLLDLHRQAQAEFVDFGDIEIVSTFGEPHAEYAAIRKSVGLMDMPQRGFLELTGADRLQFLNGLLTAETWNKQTKVPLPAGAWVYSFLLNLRGRVVADMNVLELGDRTLLETDRRIVNPLRDVFDAYLFSERVKMENRSEQLHEIVLHGPQSLRFVGDLGDLSIVSANQQSCRSLRLLGYDIVAWRDDATGTPGLHLIVPLTGVRTIWMHFVTMGLSAPEPAKRPCRPVGWATFNSTRIEAGRPLFGIDLDGAPVATASPRRETREQAAAPDTGPGMLPAETGQLERAVNLNKCYVGQEIVARMHARGQVARRLVGIKMAGDALPIAGTHVLDDQSNAVGVVTSSTNSPVLSNRAICLGVIKRPHFEIGTRLQVPAEGSIHNAEVVRLPFVDPEKKEAHG